jgi:hypothetical protein
VTQFSQPYFTPPNSVIKTNFQQFPIFLNTQKQNSPIFSGHTPLKVCVYLAQIVGHNLAISAKEGK